MYHFLIRIMFGFNWRMHYLVDEVSNTESTGAVESPSTPTTQNPKVEEFHKRIAEIALQALTLILAKNLNLIIFPQKYKQSSSEI